MTHADLGQDAPTNLRPAAGLPLANGFVRQADNPNPEE